MQAGEACEHILPTPAREAGAMYMIALRYPYSRDLMALGESTENI